ncbi:MAG: CoA transferase, partial [Chloroflexi bacterium]|nr:CoA transferase [Chloroflexota bacterium]
AEAIAEALQAAGVPSAPVLDIAAATTDPQLCAWGFGTLLDHPVAGATPYDPPPYRLVSCPPRLTPAPLLGQHTESVLSEVLGLEPAEIAALTEVGALL